MARLDDFGTTARGEKVQRITLANDRLRASFLTRGAILQDLRLDDLPYSLTPGSDDLAEYEGDLKYWGALVAPVVNRFSNGRAPLGDRTLGFARNQGGLHMLHSGDAGTWARIWQLVGHDDTTLVLSADLPHGDGGFPGNRHVEVRFSLSGATLRMEVAATSDALTFFNAANHSYWNLDGSPGWAGHRLRVAADHVLPTTDSFAPTGEIRAVEGTEFDLRAGPVITPGHPAMDHNFCLAAGRRALTEVLWLTGTSGVTMTLATTEPGVQIYDGRNAHRRGRAVYEALAIEAQSWPDAPNHEGFPPITLEPGQTCRQITEWRFSRS